MIRPKKAVMEMSSYSPPTEGREGYLRLDFNENTIGCSPRVIEKLREITAGNISTYPQYDESIKKLADFLKIDSSQVMYTNGTDEAIKTITETYVERGIDEIIIPVPTFAMFGFYAQLNEAKIKEVFYNKDLSFPTGKVLEEINPKTKIVVIVNPNNPTGTSVNRQELIEILNKAKQNDALVLVDEAYYPFFNESSIDLIEEFDNLVVLQTFSKAFGMANLRIGYIVSNKENIKTMRKVISPYSVNGIATACVSVALDDYEYVKNYVKTVNENKTRIYSELKKEKIKYYESDANFLLVDVGKRCSDYCGQLKKKGILVRDRSKDPLLEGVFRITVGTAKQTQQLIEALKEIKDREKPLLIFDIDGVLIDVSKSYRQAIKQTAEFFLGREVSENKIQDFKNRGGYNNDWDLTEAIIKSRGLDVKKSKIIDKFQELYLGGLRNNEKWLLEKEILKKLSSKYKLAIFTGRPKEEAVFSLEINGVFGYFDRIVAMEDVSKAKPNPQGLFKIMEKYESEDVIYFGDTIDDMKAAIDANITPVGVLPPQEKSGKLKNRMLKYGAKQVLNDINEIKEVLE